MTNVTFDTMPKALMELSSKIDRLISLQTNASQEHETDRLLTIEELIQFLPENPARQTIYGWVNDRLIPYEKHGKRLYFRKSNIETWLSNGRQNKGI